MEAIFASQNLSNKTFELTFSIAKFAVKQLQECMAKSPLQQ